MSDLNPAASTEVVVGVNTNELEYADYSREDNLRQAKARAIAILRDSHLLNPRRDAKMSFLSDIKRGSLYKPSSMALDYIIFSPDIAVTEEFINGFR